METENQQSCGAPIGKRDSTQGEKWVKLKASCGEFSLVLGAQSSVLRINKS